MFCLCSFPLVLSWGADWDDVSFDQYPFMANLRHPTKQCGGSIISKQPGIILTAAHMLDDINPLDIEVWIGCTRTDCTDSPSSGLRLKYKVSRYEVHEGYRQDGGMHNDVALLFTEIPIAMARAKEISLLPSMAGIGLRTPIRAVSYYGIHSSDTDTLETHVTHIVSDGQCPGADKICVEDLEYPDECGDWQRDGGLCYPHCRSGYYGSGPVCWESCDVGCTDHGLTCWCDWFDIYGKGSYGRGAGRVPDYAVENRKQGFGPGDSGSPVIFQDGNALYQIGIVSTAGLFEDIWSGKWQIDPRIATVLTSVPHFYDWITSRMG